MRSRTLFFLTFATFFILPIAASAAIPFFGPIIPQSSAQCAAGWGLVMVVINNIISFLITIAIVFVAPLMIAYSGFLFVVNPVNVGGIEKAKSILIHTVVGIVIALAGWLIVDAIMVVLYNGGPTGFGQTWQSLVTGSGPTCIPIPTTLSQVTPTAPPPGVEVPPGAPGKFTFDPGIDAQVINESAPLVALISCMATRSPEGGRITSISDTVITSGQRSFSYCATNGSQNTSPPRCAHTKNSCHYGGTGRCNGESYAVDFGDDGKLAALTSAAQACGARTLIETSSVTGRKHLHASVGADHGCGCDMSLPPPTNPSPGGGVTCPAPPADMISALLPAGMGNHLEMAQNSGQVTSIPLPNLNGLKTGQATFGERPSSPDPVTIEISINKCPGVIDTDYTNKCNLRSTTRHYNAITWFAKPHLSITDTASANLRGYCWAPEPNTQYHINARWTYSSCPFGQLVCGFVFQYNQGPY